MKRVLVTGASGRLGKYVVEALGIDFQVTAFDCNKPDFDCEFIQGDILDRVSVAQAVKNQDSVIHIAALDADATGSESRFMQVNVEGVWNVFDCAREAGVKRIVHCSSVAAINISPENPPQYLPVDIDHPADPKEVYGLTKLLGEKIARRFFVLGGMDIICLRPTYIMQPDYLYDVVKLSAEADGTQPPSPASDPSWLSYGEVIPGSRSFVDPRDVATAFRAALEADDISWGIFTVASTDSHSDLPTLELVEREFGVKPEIRNPERYADRAGASIYDISETTKALGWKPAHSWPAVLEELLATVER
ncbi:MAG: NAD(P)-dependent oxidoreductase [Rhodospirillales bacterium]|nr:NAD(P)-dependent oxidoreductase [Rhodospirillales bacterium]